MLSVFLPILLFISVFSLSIGFREEDGDKWVRGCIIVLGIVKGEERKGKKWR